MAEDADDDEIKEVPPGVAELHTSYIDTFFLSLSDQRMRIAFGEDIDGVAHYRLAIVLPIEDAEGLAKIIMDLATKRAAAKKKDEAEGKG